MLSQDDRRRLEAIEQQLEREDPELAHLLTHWPATEKAAIWAPVIGVVLAVLGGTGMLIGVLTISPGLVIISMVMLTAAWASGSIP